MLEAMRPGAWMLAPGEARCGLFGAERPLAYVLSPQLQDAEARTRLERLRSLLCEELKDPIDRAGAYTSWFSKRRVDADGIGFALCSERARGDSNPRPFPEGDCLQWVKSPSLLVPRLELPD